MSGKENFIFVELMETRINGIKKKKDGLQIMDLRSKGGLIVCVCVRGGGGGRVFEMEAYVSEGLSEKTK